MQSRRNFHGLTLSGIFYRDRDEWMRYVIGLDGLENGERLVALYIALRTNPKTRWCWPPQRVIARDLAVSKATVKRTVSKLLAAELMAVDFRVPIGGKKPVNHYTLVHPADSVGSPMIPRIGLTHDPQNNGSAE